MSYVGPLYLVIFSCWGGPVPHLELFWVGPVKKTTLYYDNSDYYQRCWGCRWAPGKSCWKQLRREGDNFVKRLQQSSRTFLSLRTFSSSLWYSSLKRFTITWILECSNRLLEEKVYCIMVISAHSANWHFFLMWQNWHLCKSHFPHQVLILIPNV